MPYRFGAFVLDTERFELVHGTTPVALQPQVFAVLAHLVEHRDRVVSKEELLDTVWGTRFVTESTLTSRIKSARRAIGDDGEAQELIRTVRGHGFRFVGAVVEAHADGRQPAAAAPAQSERTALPGFGNVLRGREHDLEEVGMLLDRHTMVTLVGTGGTGKTRLAVEVARQRLDRCPVVFVDLAAVRDADAVPEQLAASLGIQLGQRTDVTSACCEYLGAVPHLLVVDNCEHVVVSAAAIADAVVRGADGTKVLATSREPLGIGSEHLYRVGTLPTVAEADVATAEAVQASPSAALFVDRARRVDHRFEIDAANAADVAALCRALDGLPLAIELAASRMMALSLDDLLIRLDRRLDLLGESRRSTDDRQRTLRATVEWSYDALAPDAQRLLRHLAVLPAGATLDTVERFTAGLGLSADPLELVTTLVEASLLNRVETAHDARYVQLETMRTFGYDRLDHHDERGSACEVSAGWALDLVERMHAELLSPAEPYWADRITTELPNLRAVRQYLLGGERWDDVVGFSICLQEWGRLRGSSELWSWAQELVDLLPPDHPGYADALAVAALAAWRRGDFDGCRSLAERSIALVADQPERDGTRARALGELAVSILFTADYEGAAAAWLERVALREYAPDLANAAFATAYAGNIERARELAAEARRQAERTGSATCIAWSMYATGEIEHVAGSADHVGWLEAAVGLAESVGSDFTSGVAELTLASTMSESGDVAGAAAAYRRLIERWLRSGSWTQQWTTLRNSVVLLEEHDPETALALMEGANIDAFSSTLDPEAAAVEQRRRERVIERIGADRAAAVTAEAHRTPRTELAERARAALELIAAARRGGPP